MTRDGWWSARAIDPLAGPLARAVVDRTPVTPAQLTAVAALLCMAAAGGFLQAGRLWWAIGAVLYLAGGVADRAALAVAELRADRDGRFYRWLREALTRCCFLGCALGALLGQFARTEDPVYPLLAVLVVGADLVFRALTEGLPASVPVRFGLADLAFAACIAGPLTGLYLPVIVVAAVAVLCSGLSTVHRAWTFAAEPATRT
ncbi:hypothetical protein DPM19_10170 [Actinomadura craniellae]|uniref:CDP-alcohol phosphatidyltransferase family protein n=1 Tax=Actinomadura craniellae TaxID=2231787 RepID=A0A365H7J4_9ACTN|nr:hypothetical protein [Actinomadura craniellae]RAY15090.1 hypothetical protein DPM19_10170 [Actinomadura craniellae]